jgi:hypothetical protein
MSTNDKKWTTNEKGALASSPLNPTPTVNSSRDDHMAQDIRRHLHQWMCTGLPEEVVLDLYSHPDVPDDCALMEIEIYPYTFEVFIAGWAPWIRAVVDLDDLDVMLFEESGSDEHYAAHSRMTARRSNPFRWAPRAIPASAEIVVEVSRGGAA